MPLFSRKAPAPSSLDLEKLTTSLQNLDADELLSEWRWLVDKSYTPVLLSAIGDLFVQAGDGSVWWLCTANGHFTQVAPDLSEFHRLAAQPKPGSEWFLPDLVDHLRKAGLVPGPGQCYSFKLPPFLGGKVEPKNIELSAVYIHFAFTGELYFQVKDLPPGTKIRSIRLAKPDAPA